MGLSEIAVLLSLGFACVMVLFVAGLRGLYFAQPPIPQRLPVEKASTRSNANARHGDSVARQDSEPSQRAKGRRNRAA